MGRAVIVKVTQEGVLVPRLLVRAWGDIQEVEIEQHNDALVIRPKADQDENSDARQRLLHEMRIAGIVQDLPWMQPADVSAEERARLAKKMSHGQPLSQVILEDREERA